MTCESIGGEQWRLTFTEPEAAFIANVLLQLGKQYRQPVADMPPKVQAYWQGSLTREGGAAARDQLADSQEMLAEQRNELRSERSELVESWIREYELSEEHNPWAIEVSSAERDEFLSMLNDRRLLLALQTNISEQDMERDINKVADESRRATILEIDVLGHFILVMLGPQIYRP